MNCQRGDVVYTYCSIECIDEVLRLPGSDLRVFGCVSTSKMRLWSVLDHLGASWGRLGAVLEVSWRRLIAFVERHGGALELLIDFEPI